MTDEELKGIRARLQAAQASIAVAMQAISQAEAAGFGADVAADKKRLLDFQTQVARAVSVYGLP